MAEDKDIGVTQGPKKKSKLLFFIILGVGILLLGGGGFFAYTKFLTPKPHAEGAGKEAEASKEPPQVIGEVLALDPFVVNLSDPKGKRYLKVKVELELKDAIALEKAKKVAPKMKHEVIMMLTSLGFEEVMTPEGKVRVRDELLERFNRIMRPDRVKDLYFTEFVVQ